MKKQRIDGQETRLRLLDAASMVFAKKGFWETTNADICKVAQVNTASVNYHFGGKEELYISAWKYSFDKSLEAHPQDGGVPPEASPKDRLRGRILSFLQRVADPKTYEIEIMHKEMACPTGLLHKIVHSSLKTLNDGFKTIVAELLGKDANEKQILFCHMNIVNMCFGFVHYIHLSRLPIDDQNDMNDVVEIDVKDFADYVLIFSMAGINSIRKENRNSSTLSENNSKKKKRKAGNK
ncbi:MAG: CerR family C-terminal domain-containing protein [Sedimentisphaerales bacterium]|nr:CerR family C-terminal domain-containing protein [Sedimentisphaerales bacterium]